MPIPSPGKDESRDDFMSRCMGDDVMMKEFPQDQRYKVCEAAWKKGKKKPEKREK